jgi:hypothetical protein
LNYETKYLVAINPATRTKSIVQAKNDAKKTFIGDLRRFCMGHLLHNVLITNTDLDLLQLPIRDTTPTPIPPPSTWPTGRVDTGIPVVRNAISRRNTEGVIAGVTNMLAVVNRNVKALEAKRMKSALLDEIAATTQEINALNVRQNELESERNCLTEENTEMFNDLWINLICRQ